MSVTSLIHYIKKNGNTVESIGRCGIHVEVSLQLNFQMATLSGTDRRWGLGYSKKKEEENNDASSFLVILIQKSP